MRIREAEWRDSVQIAVLCEQFGYPAESEQIRERLTRIAHLSEHQIFVADLNGSIVGWIHVHGVHSLGSDPYAEIRGLVVDHTQRQQGVGRQLMISAENWARDNGYQIVRLRSSTGRVEAHHFYPKVGYVRIKSQHLYQKMLLEDA